MALGFSVETLLPRARVEGPLRMGLERVAEDEWLQPDPDLAARGAGFDAHPESVMVLPEAEAGSAELAALLGVEGGLEAAARSVWEDLCLLTQDAPGAPYRLTGAAVAFPTDWRLTDKIGKPLMGVHAPIHGYAEQLASAVDGFMERLAPGDIFGRTNVFVLPTDALRYQPQGDPAAAFSDISADNAGERLYARCERETLRRLPQSGAIVFTIGIYRTRLAELSDEAIARLERTLDGFIDGEKQRRTAPHYASALAGFAALRRGEAQGRAA